MRRPVWLLLALVLLCALPGRALADSPHLSDLGQYSSCGVPLRDDDAWASPRLQCMAGVAATVSWNGMKVRPARGNLLRVRFTDATLFATDSGEGVLDGLVAGDYVCVTYAPHSGTVTALLVLFDPDFPPCGRHLHRTSSDVTDGSPIMSPVLSSASTRFSKDCWRPPELRWVQQR